MHCVLEFNQSQWLKPYIEFNAEKRIAAETDKDKDGRALYKLMLYTEKQWKTEEIELMQNYYTTKKTI